VNLMRQWNALKTLSASFLSRDALLIAELLRRSWFTRIWVSDTKNGHTSKALIPFCYLSGSAGSCTFSSGCSNLWHVLCGLGSLRSLAVPGSPSNSCVTEATKNEHSKQFKISPKFDLPTESGQGIPRHSQLCFRSHSQYRE
jgi:hypothetical protein